jgi:hypothetical protein
MKRVKCVLLSFAVYLCGVLPAVAAASPKVDYGKLPLTFEANQGQADSTVKFLSR